jgi:hypothetical protein
MAPDPARPRKSHSFCWIRALGASANGEQRIALRLTRFAGTMSTFGHVVKYKVAARPFLRTIRALSSGSTSLTLSSNCIGGLPSHEGK